MKDLIKAIDQNYWVSKPPKAPAPLSNKQVAARMNAKCIATLAQDGALTDGRFLIRSANEKIKRAVLASSEWDGDGSTYKWQSVLQEPQGISKCEILSWNYPKYTETPRILLAAGGKRIIADWILVKTMERILGRKPIDYFAVDMGHPIYAYIGGELVGCLMPIDKDETIEILEGLPSGIHFERSGEPVQIGPVHTHQKNRVIEAKVGDARMHAEERDGSWTIYGGRLGTLKFEYLVEVPTLHRAKKIISEIAPYIVGADKNGIPQCRRIEE